MAWLCPMCNEWHDTISSLGEEDRFLAACLVNGFPIIVLDNPNDNETVIEAIRKEKHIKTTDEETPVDVEKLLKTVIRFYEG